MLQTAFGASVFKWHKRFKEGRESVRDDERCGRKKEVNKPQSWLAKGLRLGLGLLCWGFKGVQGEIPSEEASTQWHFHLDNTPVHNSILITDYLTKMGIKTVPQPPYSPVLAPSDVWLFPKLKEKLRGCRYETIAEMKKAVTKVIYMLTQEDFPGAWRKLLERYSKCIADGGDYLEGDKSFVSVLSIKVPIRKNVWKLIVCAS